MDTTVDTKINHHKENIGEPTQTQSEAGKHLCATVSCGNSLKGPDPVHPPNAYFTESKTLKVALYSYFM